MAGNGVTMRTLQINGIIPATQLVSVGDGPTLIGNKDITTSLWVANTNAFLSNRPDVSIEITPQSWIVVDGTEDVFGITAGPVISVNLIPGGTSFFQSGITGGGFIVNNNGSFFYAGTPGLGTLLCAITGTNASGVDQYGNVYTPGGMSIIGNPNATSLFTLLDNSNTGSALLSMASDGSISTEGALNAGSDLTIAGLSVVNDIIPTLAQGLIARTSVLAASLPAPATPVTGEFFLYELDFDVIAANREYLLIIEPMAITLSGAGKLRTNIYGTSDGSQPTNASPVIATSEHVATMTANFATRIPASMHPFSPNAVGTWRLLVSITTLGSGGTNPTMQMVQGNFAPTGANDGYSGSNARFSVYDMGPTVPNTGRVILTGGSSGSGGGTKNYTKTYTSNGSHCYEGSDGTFPNQNINHNGNATQGGDRANTFNGRAKTWFTFNTTAIVNDLAGATITAVKIYLNNNHSWFNSGMTAAIGYDSQSTYGSSKGDPSGVGIDAIEPHFNEGQARWVDATGQGFGTAFQNGSANTIVLFKNSNNLQYYGYFAGNDRCQMRISYTK